MEIYFYEENGKSPVQDFLESLPPKIEGRFTSYLVHLQKAEGKMEGVMFRKLHGYPMEEIRVKESNDLHRVIIRVEFRKAILVLHGFTKKEGQETPKKELEIAYQRLLRMTRNEKQGKHPDRA